jgi:hypothetical protein
MQDRQNILNAPDPSASTSGALKRDPGTPVRRVTDEAKRAKLETLRKIKQEKSESQKTRPADSQNQPVFFSEVRSSAGPPLFYNAREQELISKSSGRGSDASRSDDLRMITDLTGDSD